MSEIDKGRKKKGKGWRVGEIHHRAKLTDHDVDLILCLYEEYAMTQVMIAEKFEVSPMNISLIVNGKTRSRKAGRVEHG
jgi:hypothetical protein